MGIEERINTIEERNRKVEGDKAWEVSTARRIFIVILTFLLAWLWLWLIGEGRSYFKALVPAVGYWLSTVSLNIVKNHWLKKNQRII